MNLAIDCSDNTLDARLIPCAARHSEILQRWKALPLHEHFVLLTDHDPIPLYYQLGAEFPGEFTWEYLQREPENIRIKIQRTGEVNRRR